VDLRLAVDAALKIIRAQNSSTGIEMRWHRPDQPVMCHGDLIRIEQVMVNLIANAVQALEGRDDPAIDIMIDDDGDHWRCRVRDNGHGLPGNTEQVFEPFSPPARSNRGWGSGYPSRARLLRRLVAAWSATIAATVRV